MSALSLSAVLELFRNRGAERLYVKILAENDNSKNQVYLAGSFEPLNLLPSSEPIVRESAAGRRVLHASMRFSWLTEDGTESEAPATKLILYPQYPEVRLSGFLKGCTAGPNHLMGTEARVAGRILLLGVRPDGLVLGFVAGPETQLARETVARYPRLASGVLTEIPLGGTDTRTALLTRLLAIAAEGWIPSVRLDAAGKLSPCNARNCGGYTLEARLGVRPNSRSLPDFLGWEVKQFGVKDLSNPRALSSITLMTPEPTAGHYRSLGVVDFVRRYGYPDVRGREDRRNFGGVYRLDRKVERTGVTMRLLGYDNSSQRITDVDGGLALMDANDELLALWPFPGLIGHWNRKHGQAVFVPSISLEHPTRFRFGRTVFLGMGTDFGLFLRGVVSGAVVYDPGIKVEAVGTATPTHKRRSQFRIRFADLPVLYHRFERTPLG